MMDSLIWDLVLVVPMHMVNALTFLVWRFKLLGEGLHAYDKPVSVKLFGKHREYIGMMVMFIAGVAAYSLILGNLCIWVGAGMVAGTYLNSFIKRRLKIKPGASLPVFDDLDFFIGGVAGLALCGVFLNNLLLMAALSFALHIIAELFAYATGMKEVWW
jgi:CDP-2,3-bis-(O-geranylgeranyl)-sn-glycerol synthase